MIKLKNIRKSFGDGASRINNVLCGVDMRVESGEFVAIKGASGSGKTTLLSILGTLLAPDSGSYILDGTDMSLPGVDRPRIRNGKIGFVFQDHRLMPQYTALENILLPALAQADKVSEEQLAYAHKLMEITHIESVAHQYPPTLSGGEASRVAVCRALIMHPSVVLADEPTGQLDAENAHTVARLLSELNQALGTTIIMVTHSEETSSVADRVLTLKEGKLL